MNHHTQPSAIDRMAKAAISSTRAILSLPFDVAQSGYALSVKAGLVQDSMLACAGYARSLSRSEKLALGPWARQR